ncbi:MAG: hypothetical protein ACM3L6_03050 [Deltaproteobacteria bacterium]
MKIRPIVTALLLAAMVFANAGCALLNTALAAGASYAIYQATR